MELIGALGVNPVVPPKEYDRERFFRPLKAFRAMRSRYDKLDRIFTASIHLSRMRLSFRCVNAL
jgi:hypothetical protein